MARRVTQARLKELLSYDAGTGIFRWLITRSPKVSGGDVAGCFDTTYGYVTIKIDYVVYRAHRLAWLYVTGSWPRALDHKNRVRSDNRFDNLREATTAQNGQNRNAQKKSKTGVNGVCWYKPRKRWKASIVLNGVDIYLGIYKKIEDAIAARRAAEDRLYTHHR